MDKIFQIGDFTFRLCCPEEIMPPPNFMLFERGDTECALEKGSENSSMKETAEPEYTYRMHVAEELPVPEGKVIARRPDLTVYECGNRESRLIGVKGTEGYYACYRENDLSSAEITFAADRIGGLHIDPVFSSLLALERRLVKKDSMILHCAYVEYQGEAILFSAPSETGKTTQSWGLLRMENARLISDDWYFVSFGTGRPSVSGSEKNCYIDADIGDVWEEYRPLVKEVRFDNKGRGIGNVRWVAGEGSVIGSTSMRYVFLLQRDPSDQRLIAKLDPEEALDYLSVNGFCNPHQLVCDLRRSRIRRDFYSRYLSECDVYMVNTTGTPEDTQRLIRGAITEGCGL